MYKLAKYLQKIHIFQQLLSRELWNTLRNIGEMIGMEERRIAFKAIQLIYSCNKKKEAWHQVDLEVWVNGWPKIIAICIVNPFKWRYSALKRGCMKRVAFYVGSTSDVHHKIQLPLDFNSIHRPAFGMLVRAVLGCTFDWFYMPRPQFLLKTQRASDADSLKYYWTGLPHVY